MIIQLSWVGTVKASLAEYEISVSGSDLMRTYCGLFLILVHVLGT